MYARFMPWRDRAGRLSWLKLVVFVLMFVPGLWLALQLQQGWLAPKPITEALHETGQTAVRLLLLTLLVSPLRKLAGWGKLIAVRRMLGVGALAYGAIHLGLYVLDQHYDLVRVASEIVLRFYLTIGFVALLGLVALGVTSTDRMIKRLGAARWTRLHALTYPIAVLGLLHFMIQSKLDVTEPVLMSGLFLLLMGQRLLKRWGLSESVPALAGLAIAAPLMTALLEAVWYAVRNAIPLTDVLMANVDFDAPLRPAWWVLAAGIALLAARLARRLWVSPPVRRAVAGTAG